MPATHWFTCCLVATMRFDECANCLNRHIPEICDGCVDGDLHQGGLDELDFDSDLVMPSDSYDEDDGHFLNDFIGDMDYEH